MRRSLRWGGCGLGALLVNLALFLLPVLVAGPQMPDDIPEDLGAVRLSSFTTPQKNPSQENSDQPQPDTPEDFMESVPREVLETVTPMDQPKLDFDLPQAEFDINPALAEGMAVPVMSAPARVAAPAPAPAGGALAVGELDERPAQVFAPEPQYPLQARRRGLTGDLKVRLVVDKRGHVTNVEIVGGKNADVFAESVERTVRRWRFKPGKQGGKPVSWTAVVSITFDRE